MQVYVYTLSFGSLCGSGRATHFPALKNVDGPPTSLLNAKKGSMLKH